MQRIGIYAGTFDPVHSGHIAFALQAAAEAQLDEIYFLPERRPRNKQGVEHFGHRVAMLRRAIKPHPRFSVLELNDVSLNIERTLPKLKNEFAADQLVFLFGSDVVTDIPAWPGANRLLRTVELVVGLRQGCTKTYIEQTIASWQTPPRQLIIVDSFAPAVSSRHVRRALSQRERVAGLLSSVERYSGQNWLYVSLDQVAGR